MQRFLVGFALTLSLSGCIASTQQEVALGTEYAAQINQQLPIVQDAEVVRYINALGNSIARPSDARDLNWQFYVVDSREVNAFAVPGGYVYVNRGLIERVRNMSQLAGVVGHEIAHVTERHSMERMRDSERANLGITVACVLTGVCNNSATGAVVNVAGGAVFARFSRDDENQADRVGIRHVVAAGIHPRGVPEMFRILLDERQRSPSSVEAFFATHPLAEDRITSTQSYISQLSAAQLSGLQTDSEEFQRFKRRLQSLPASPAPRQ